MRPVIDEHSKASSRLDESFVDQLLVCLQRDNSFLSLRVLGPDEEANLEHSAIADTQFWNIANSISLSIVFRRASIGDI
jgi:hypothetical protein